MSQRVFALIFYCVVSLVFLRGILASPGLISGGDWGLPEAPDQMRAYAAQGVFMWRHNTESLFGLAASNLNDCFFRLFVGGLSFLGINGAGFVKFLLIFMFTLAGFSLYSYCRFLKLGFFPSLVGGFYFVTTPLFFNYIIMGWLFVILSLALFPWTLMAFTKAVKTRKGSYAILTSLLFSIAVFQSQSLVWYPLALFLLAWFIVTSKSEIKTSLKFLGLVFLIFFLVNAHWIFAVLMPQNPLVTQKVSSFDIDRFQEKLSFLGLLRLWGGLRNYQYESTWSHPWMFLSMVPPLLAYSALLLRRSRRVIYFVCLSLLPWIFFLGRGFFAFIPFSNVVRDVGRFMVLSNLAYAVLSAMVIDALCCYTKKASLWNFRGYRFKRFVGYGLVFLVVLLSCPFWIGELYGESSGGFDIRLRTLQFPKEYYEVEQSLKGEKSGLKALYLPLGGRVGLLNDKRFFGMSREICDLFSIYAPVPAVIGLSDRGNGIASDFIDILRAKIFSHNSGYLTELLGLASIKYLIIRLGMYQGSQTPSMKEIARRFEAVDGLSRICNSELVEIFENTRVLPLIYPASSVAIVRGPVSNLGLPVLMPYFKRHPVFAFEDQQRDLGIETLMKGLKKPLRHSVLWINRDSDHGSTVNNLLGPEGIDSIFKKTEVSYFFDDVGKHDEVEKKAEKYRMYQVFTRDCPYELMGGFSLKKVFRRTGESFSRFLLESALKENHFFQREENISKMKMQGVGCPFQSSFRKGICRVKGFFNGSEDEFVKIQYLNPGPELIGDEGRLGGAQWIDLNKYPYLALKYKVQDP
ncbi:MAG: hypothetical protein HYS08_10240, partial [Chlamydiae bacterium]|nr:hypothetical protein [Chlamydiota bacterium]MBI3266643.1 hypothetical protein [Chlamydiota bacterium]